MSAKTTGLEARAGALLARMQGHNAGLYQLSDLEIQGVLAEVLSIVQLSASYALSTDVLQRVDRILKQAVEEVSKVVENSIGNDASTPR